MNMRISCDIFCNVIDNFGDIGVSWRLARQLANEFDLDVRLFVDDLASFAKLCPEADIALEAQSCRGVEVRLWRLDFSDSRPGVSPPLRGDPPADLVIEAFGCKLPPDYVEAMAAAQHPPVWINLEYLSAEDWVEGCHKLPSPHPRLALTKYFFFPGFTEKTGGLLIERDLLARRDEFMSDAALQQAFWQSIGIGKPADDTLKISMFAYENEALYDLFDAWGSGERPVLCLVPEGRILPQVVNYFGGAAGKAYSRGNLSVRILPFVRQEDYDELLWICDINFVRGEDSCVRAQWAGKPFVWQIYPQHDAVHWQKLQAFLDLYCSGLGAEAAQVMHDLWQIWNGGAVADSLSTVWGSFLAERGELVPRAQVWASQLAQNNLALNLLDFSQEIGTIRAFKIEGQ